MDTLTAFQRDCLYTIAELGDPKGTAIKDALDEYYETEVHHGRLYPALSELVDDGLVSQGKKDDRTNEYQLSDEGIQILQNRREWEGDLPG